jgi:hypothetical protein
MFVKGTSGNPGGRAKIAIALRDAGIDAKQLRADVIKKLVKLFEELDPQTASFRYVSRELCDRLWGKPREHVEVTLDEGNLVDEVKLSDDQLALLAAIGMRDDGAPTEH